MTSFHHVVDCQKFHCYKSTSHEQKNGIPQGSVMSVTLFLIGINKIEQMIGNNVKFLLYTDDLVIYMSGNDMNLIARSLQITIDNLCEWLETIGLNFSEAKTKYMHFSRKYKKDNIRSMTLKGVPIEAVQEHKFLGLTMDQKLSWKNHIKKLKTDTTKRLNIIKMLSHTSWGAHRKNLINIHKALIIPKLDYGSICYGSASPNVLKSLNPVHNTGIRMATGAFITSPIPSILAEAGIANLEQIREKTLAKYVISLQARKYSPTYSCLLHHNAPTDKNYQKFFFTTRANTISMKYTITEHVAEQNITPLPPWEFSKPLIDLRMHNRPTYNYAAQQFLEILNTYTEPCTLYTDGSKNATNVAFAVVNNTSHFSQSIVPIHSSFSAEALAILKAIEMCQPCNRTTIIVTDSLSTLQSMQNISPKNPIIQKIQLKLKEKQMHIVFCWVPGHNNISGNELADNKAKEALNLAINNTHMPTKNDWNAFIIDQWKQHNIENWQSLDSNNKLRMTKNAPVPWQSSNRTHRKESCLITLLRIGHSRLTHSHLLDNNYDNFCNNCNIRLTIEHILIDCPKYSNERLQYNIASSLNTILRDTTAVENTLAFLKEINLFQKSDCN